MANAIRINPFAFLTPNAIQSHKDANVLASSLFEEVPVELGIDWIYKALSHTPQDSVHGEVQQVNLFEAANFGVMDNDKKMSSDVLYVDEEGLYNNLNDCWIVIRGAWQPFAGAGLVVGTTYDGDTTPPKNVTIDWLKQNVIILVQNMLYVPRVGRVGFTVVPAVRFAQKAGLCSRDNPFWTDPNILS